MVDNGAQIGWLGLLMYTNGYKTPLNKSSIFPKQRTDDVKVIWRKN
jgi:tRNA A37 threonylcarbamoyltransferase TsaD